jgi:serine/threonine protein kinase
VKRQSEGFPSPRSDIADPFDLTTRRAGRSAETEALGYRSGEVIDESYVLVRVIARGPSAAVWVAQELVFGKQFALKMLRDPSGMVHATERVAREARLLARIQHPNVVQVVEFGVTKWADPYLVMELLSGPTLEELLARAARMRPTEAVQLLLPIADALAVAHGLGILHRDLKPQNVVCIRNPLGYLQPKVIDFGIAIERGPDNHITQTGIVLGSPEYLAPERARGGRDDDPRSDLWSFCITLYELVAGRTPFYDPSDATRVLEAVLEGAVPPLSDFGVDEPELDAILARGLQKAPQGRWPDMRALGRALAAWLVLKGTYEDTEGNSLETTWLTVSSVAPVAMDADRGVPSSFPADFSSYRIPKRSWGRSVVGIGAAAIAFGSIAVASLQTSGHLGSRASVATRPPPLATTVAQIETQIASPVAVEPALDAGPEPELAENASEDFGVRSPEPLPLRTNPWRARVREAEPEEFPSTIEVESTIAPESAPLPVPEPPPTFE